MKNLFRWKNASEEKSFFENRSEVLNKKLKDNYKTISESKELGKKIGIEDDATLYLLKEVGFDTESIDLVFFIPSVLIAWDNGSLTNKQMEFVKTFINDSNINNNNLYGVLLKMKDEYPCKKVSTAALRAIRIKLETSTDIEGEKTKRSLEHYCEILGVKLNRKITFGMSSSVVIQDEIEKIRKLLFH